MRIARYSFVALLSLSLAACGGGDDGGGGDGDGGAAGDPDATPVTPTAFRIDNMTLSDPHTFALGAVDVTSNVDELIINGVMFDNDDPADGLLDLSILPVFRPLATADATNALDIVFADCTAPQDTTRCTRTTESDVVVSTATNSTTTTCLDVLANTTGGYEEIILPTAPCFSSDAETFTVDLGGVELGMIDARIAATYQGAEPTSMTNGLIRGYVTEEVADNAIIPEDTLLVGGDPLSAILKDEDMDTGPNGESGWWFYLHFTASVADYTE
jgi:hypothetical protein